MGTLRIKAQNRKNMKILHQNKTSKISMKWRN